MKDTAEELFDVVDEHDNVIACRPRSEVHRLGLRHRAVHIFLFRPDGCLLTHLRTADKEEFPGVWTSSASGHVASDEDYASAAERELAEELGIQASLKRVRKFAACPDTSHEFTVLYVAESNADVSPDPKEIADTRWLSPAEIHQWLTRAPQDFSPAFRLLFTAFHQPACD
ncbi:MAG: NUDIX domain-containing protein [Fuerstiella sp.]